MDSRERENASSSRNGDGYSITGRDRLPACNVFFEQYILTVDIRRHCDNHEEVSDEPNPV
jgi:hypothetical protein